MIGTNNNGTLISRVAATLNPFSSPNSDNINIDDGDLGDISPTYYVPNSLLEIPAAHACIKKVSSYISQCRLSLRTSNNGVLSSANDLAGYSDLADIARDPTRVGTYSTFLNDITTDLLCNGRTYAMWRNEGGRVWLTFLPFSTVQEVRNDRGLIEYHHTQHTNQFRIGGRVSVIPSDRLLRFSYRTTSGVNLLETNRKLFRRAVILENWTTSRLSTPDAYRLLLSQDVVGDAEKSRKTEKSLVRKLFRRFSKGRAIIMPSGTTATEFGRTAPKDDSLVELRTQTIQEIAALFGIQAWQIGQPQGAGNFGASVASVSRDFAVETLQPILYHYEQVLNKALISPRVGRVANRPVPFFRFSTAPLTPISRKEQAEIDAISLGGGGGMGWRTANEIRQERGLPDNPDGDCMAQPRSNNITLTNNEG